MGDRDKDEDEEEEDDEKRSQRLGMVRTDARTFADELTGAGAQKTQLEQLARTALTSAYSRLTA